MGPGLALGLDFALLVSASTRTGTTAFASSSAVRAFSALIRCMSCTNLSFSFWACDGIRAQTQLFNVVWLHHPYHLRIPMVWRNKYGDITPAFSGSPWCGEINRPTAYFKPHETARASKTVESKRNPTHNVELKNTWN